jgi:5-formyltetrahydrofolate cyclo-ligase
MGRGQALEVRAWAPGDALIDAAYGTRVPPESAAAVTPGLLLVPLLAYDERGYRLGYGGGFYDRSLAALSSPIAVGCAYDAQAIDEVPTDDHDRRLDWIVTEKRILEIT